MEEKQFPTCPDCGEEAVKIWANPGIEMRDGRVWVHKCEKCGELFKCKVAVAYAFVCWKPITSIEA